MVLERERKREAEREERDWLLIYIILLDDLSILLFNGLPLFGIDI